MNTKNCAAKVFCFFKFIFLRYVDQILSNGLRFLFADDLYCEGVIPVTDLNCEERYAEDE